MLENLRQLDQDLFLYLNELHSPFLDPVFLFITSRAGWIPLYLVLVALIIKHFKKDSIVILVAIGVLIIFTDQFTSSFMKPYFGRLRPCHDPALMDLVHLPGRCGGKFSFVSGHAANTFALATFVFLIFRNTFKYVWLMFLWSSIVAYSRIYVGVHYPGDIIIGALSGSLFAYLVFRITMLYFEKKGSPALQKIKPLH